MMSLSTRRMNATLSRTARETWAKARAGSWRGSG